MTHRRESKEARMTRRAEWKHVDVETPAEPGEETLFLVWVEGETYEPMVAYFDASEEWRDSVTEEEIRTLTDGGEVTHWMELPPSPARAN